MGGRDRDGAPKSVMAGDPDHLNDAAAWADAVAYMNAHGDRWPHLAVAHLNILAEKDDHHGFKRWLDLMTKMSEIAETSRQ